MIRNSLTAVVAIVVSRVDTQRRETARTSGCRLTLRQEGVITRRLVEAGGGLKSVQGGRVMPVYRARVHAGDAGRGRNAVGSTEDGRGGGGRQGRGGLLTDMRGRSRQQRHRRSPVGMMGDRRDRRAGAMMATRARARGRDIAVRLLISLP